MNNSEQGAFYLFITAGCLPVWEPLITVVKKYFREYNSSTNTFVIFWMREYLSTTVCLMTISWSINFSSVSFLCHCHFWKLCDNLISPLIHASWVGFLFCWRPPVEDHMTLLCCFVMFCIWLQGKGPNSELNGVSVLHGSSPSEHAHGCFKEGCQEVCGGPTLAHPTRQLLPYRRPSTNNLLWEEVSVCSVGVCSI